MQTLYIQHKKCNLIATGDHNGLVSVAFANDIIHADTPNLCPEMQHARQELTEYLNGNLRQFTIKINAQGTDFQQRVWKILLTIPYGKTVSYQWLALQINNPKTIRAAAAASGKNKLLIIVPCHRVIGKNGALTGFAAGLPAKQMLLQHEQPDNLHLF
jgi:methylated-DNA-[protein]-cysteine S-methyltransferase